MEIQEEFKYDIFLGGPRDNPNPKPGDRNQRVLLYKQPFRDAFPEGSIYDWETYTGDNYQEQNHLAIRSSKIMVAMVPEFPMPGIGPEIGYFYCCHEYRIKNNPETPQIILIWLSDIEKDFTKKTLAQYGRNVSTVEEAIALAKQSLDFMNFGPAKRQQPDVNCPPTCTGAEDGVCVSCERFHSSVFPNIGPERVKHPKETAKDLINLIIERDPDALKPAVERTPPLSPGSSTILFRQ